MIKLFLSLVLCCFLSSSSIAATNNEVLNASDPNYNIELNDILQQIQSGITTSSGSINTLNGYFSGGTLLTKYGGTSNDLSACPTGSVFVTSSLGIGNCLGPGTATYVLTSNGVGFVPSYQAPVPATVGYNLVSTTTMSTVSTSADVTIDKTKMYLVKAIITASSAGAITQLIFNGGSGNYQYVNVGFDTSAVASNSNNAAASQINMGVLENPSTSANQDIEFFIYPQATAGAKQILVTGKETFTVIYHDFMGYWANTADVTKFNLLRSTGTMSGTIYLYELKTS